MRSGDALWGGCELGPLADDRVADQTSFEDCVQQPLVGIGPLGEVSLDLLLGDISVVIMCWKAHRFSSL